MSWQAFAKPESRPPLILSAFSDAHVRASRIANGCADGYLREGSLHLNDSALGFAYAFNIIPFGDVLSVDDVRTLSPKPLIGDESNSFIEGYWSAVKFVEVCQRFGLGIGFSY